jgi:glycolate oxidase iron-sulfur subunit
MIAAFPGGRNPSGDPEAAGRVALADACVLCGLCLPACPTYGLGREEGESPRGRIMLMKGVAEGRIGPQPGVLAHLDQCLACRNCEQVCPAHVDYGALLVRSRAALRPTRAMGWRQRALEWIVARPARMRLAMALRRWLPLPRIPQPPARAQFAPLYRPEGGVPHGRVGLFLGCLGPHHDAATARAAIALLTRAGWEVAVPPAQGCCGAVHRHAGASAGADELAARNRQAFGGLSMWVTIASGCHETVALGAPRVRVVDIFDLLADADLPLRAATPGTRVALHLPCTQRTVVRNAKKIEPLLRRIAGIDLHVLPETGCCGAAGTHMLTLAGHADALRRPLLEAVRASGAATLCTSNVGCRLHLSGTLPVQHPIELLAEHLA